MLKNCDHHVPETKKGAGPCEIVSEVKKRNGKPNWWCLTHSLAASAPDGAALPACPGSWFDAEPDEKRLSIDAADGELAIWGSIPPAIAIGAPPTDSGRVHVHHRPEVGARKDQDGSYNIVTVTNGTREVVIEGMAAVAFSISELTMQSVVSLTCRRCGQVHIDEEVFATNPHRKHLCNHCGRNFRDADGPSISNPLADIYERLEIARPGAAVAASRSIDLASTDFGSIAIWPSNAAILSTMSRPEEFGLHVHAWNHDGDQVLDDTYDRVVLDGDELDHEEVRWLAVQRSLAHGAPVASQGCTDCGVSLISPAYGWIAPTTTHECACGGVTRTRRKVFLNPLAGKYAA